MGMQVRLFFVIVSALILFPVMLWAYGEGGDIPYTSRAIHLMNEARLDSAYALRDCGANCSEGVSCYQKTVDPHYWNDEFFRAAQFHANMLSILDNCMQDTSPCELV